MPQAEHAASMRASGEGNHSLDPETAEWLSSLRDARRDEAIGRLHGLLLRVARSEIRRRNTGGQITGPEVDDLAHQAAADAVLLITNRLDEFRGESRFTTWAYKFVVFEVSTKLGRHFWKRHRAPSGAVGLGPRTRPPRDPAGRGRRTPGSDRRCSCGDRDVLDPEAA